MIQLSEIDFKRIEKAAIMEATKLFRMYGQYKAMNSLNPLLMKKSIQTKFDIPEKKPLSYNDFDILIESSFRQTMSVNMEKQNNGKLILYKTLLSNFKCSDGLYGLMFNSNDENYKYSVIRFTSSSEGDFGINIYLEKGNEFGNFLFNNTIPTKLSTIQYKHFYPKDFEPTLRKYFKPTISDNNKKNSSLQEVSLNFLALSLPTKNKYFNDTADIYINQKYSRENNQLLLSKIYASTPTTKYISVDDKTFIDIYRKYNDNKRSLLNFFKK